MYRYENPFHEHEIAPRPKFQWLKWLSARAGDLMVWIGGGDRALLAECPARDANSVKVIGAMLIIVGLWQLGWFTLAAHMVFAKPDEIHPSFAAFAVLPVLIILLFDSHSMVRPSWMAHGLRDLEQHGLKVAKPKHGKTKNALMFCGRLALSLIVAQIIASLVSLILYAADIGAEIDRGHLQQNAALMGPATKRVDAELGKNADARVQSEAQIIKLQEEAKALRQISVDPTADLPEVQAALARVARLEAAKNEADRKLAEAQSFANGELGGSCRPGMSCRPGYGPARRAADERVAIATRNAEAAARALTDAHNQMRDLQAAKAGDGTRKAATAESRLKEVLKAQELEEARLAALQKDFQRLSEGREEAIRKSIEADPNFVPKDEGFLARMRALKRVTEADSWAGTMVLMLDLMFVGIELGAVLAKTSSFIPMDYARKLARAEVIGAVAAAKGLADDIQRATRVTPPNATSTQPAMLSRPIVMQSYPQAATRDIRVAEKPEPSVPLPFAFTHRPSVTVSPPPAPKAESEPSPPAAPELPPRPARARTPRNGWSPPVLPVRKPVTPSETLAQERPQSVEIAAAPNGPSGAAKKSSTSS